jgi:hypothetical protein
MKSRRNGKRTIHRRPATIASARVAVAWSFHEGAVGVAMTFEARSD